MDKMRWLIAALLSVVVGVISVLGSLSSIYPDISSFTKTYNAEQIMIPAIVIAIGSVLVTYIISVHRHRKNKGKIND